MSNLQKYMCRKKAKDINVQVFDTIANKNEAKTMTQHISRYCKYKFNVQLSSNQKCNSNQKWNNKTCQCEGKNYRMC